MKKSEGILRREIALRRLLERRRAQSGPREYIVPLSAPEGIAGDALVIEVEAHTSVPWMPARLTLPTVVHCNYEIVGFSAGLLLPVKMGNGGATADYHVKEPRLHKPGEKIIVRVRRRRPTVITRWISAVIGKGVEESAPVEETPDLTLEELGLEGDDKEPA